MRTSRSNGPRATREAVNSNQVDVRDFAELAAEQAVHVEHQTIPGFLRRIPHKWHLNEITRFGNEVGRAAEAMQLVFMTAVDRSLGVIRVFPLPLLERVYTLNAPQFGWPAIEQVPALEESREKRDELRKHEAARKHLENTAQRAPTPAVSDALGTVLEWMDSEAARLRGFAPAAQPQEPTPFRPV